MPTFSLAETLKLGIDRKHDAMIGMEPDYEYVVDSDDDKKKMDFTKKLSARVLELTTHKESVILPADNVVS